MTASAHNEAFLILQAKEDSAKFAALYDIYFDPIYRYVRRRVSDQFVVEDLVSQTFYDALSHIGAYEDRGYPFSAWLYKIAHNNVLKWYKRNWRAEGVDIDVLEDRPAEVDLVAEQRLREGKESVREALDKLCFDDQELIRLKYFEELSNVDIAVVMGLSANNVGVKLYRALKRLKDLLIMP